MARLRIHLSREVRAELDADQVAAVLDGRAVQPVFECITCRRPADARQEAANGVLWVGTDAAMLTLIHASCGPSEVRFIEEWSAMPPANVAPGGEPEPTTWATVMAGADGTAWATLMLQPGTGVLVAVGAEVLDVERQHLVEQGWGIGLTDVPVVAGWSVRIRAGRFVGIRRAGGSDDYWTAPDPTLMPEAWQRAASDHGRVLVLVVSPGALDGVGAGGLDDKILELAAAGDLAAGLLALDLEGEG